jgi:hypothetical protein
MMYDIDYWVIPLHERHCQFKSSWYCIWSILLLHDVPLQFWSSIYFLLYLDLFACAPFYTLKLINLCIFSLSFFSIHCCWIIQYETSNSWFFIGQYENPGIKDSFISYLLFFWCMEANLCAKVIKSWLKSLRLVKEHFSNWNIILPVTNYVMARMYNLRCFLVVYIYV